MAESTILNAITSIEETHVDPVVEELNVELGDAKKRKLTSSVWIEFERTVSKDGECFAICLHCKKKLSAGSSKAATDFVRRLLNRDRKGMTPAQFLSTDFTSPSRYTNLQASQIISPSGSFQMYRPQGWIAKCVPHQEVILFSFYKLACMLWKFVSSRFTNPTLIILKIDSRKYQEQRKACIGMECSTFGE